MRKKGKFFLSLLMGAAVFIPTVFDCGAFDAKAADTFSENATGTKNDYSYELWKDSGNTSMTLGNSGEFSCSWSNINNALFRRGKKLDSTQTYDQLGNIKVEYNSQYNPSGNSYLCVYGWSIDPLVEYYIVDSWGTWRPPGGTSKGTVNVDGGTYDVYETTRTNQPSIQGTKTFKQYWSVRTAKRTSGAISVSEHFKAWDKLGLKLGKMYEVSLTVEGYQSSGDAKITKNVVTMGGSSQDTSDEVVPDNKPDNSDDAKPEDNPENNTDTSGKKVIAFTFDDGPVGIASPSSSSRILDVMEKYNSHCTFFYWGNKINDSNIAELKRAYSLGCELGNHSFTHNNMTEISSDEVKSEISKTNQIISGITGQSRILVRPPYGATNNNVSAAIGAPLINWSLDSGDWNNGTYDSVLNKIKGQVKDGSIILMHETYDFTAQAVETLVPELIEQNYKIVSVSELMKIKGIELENGKLYTNQAEGKSNVNDTDTDEPKETPEVIPEESAEPAETIAPADDYDNEPKTADAAMIMLAVVGVLITGSVLCAKVYYDRKKKMI